MLLGPTDQRLQVKITGRVVPVPQALQSSDDVVLAIAVENIDPGGEVEAMPEMVLVGRSGRGSELEAHLNRFVTVSGYLREEVDREFPVLRVVRIDV